MNKIFILMSFISVLAASSAFAADTQLSKGQSLLVCGSPDEVNSQITSQSVSESFNKAVGGAYETVYITAKAPFSVSGLASSQVVNGVCVLVTKL